MIPSLISSPISFVVSYIFIFLEIGYRIWLPSTIFIILLSFLVLLKLYNVKRKSFYQNMNSARGSIIDEMIPNIKLIKLTSSEKIFEKVLMKVRLEEVKALEKIHTVNSFNNFIEMMMPILCSIASIAFFNISTGRVLSVEDTYAIVSVLYISSTPFNNLTTIFEKLGYFWTSHKAFAYFIQNVIEKNDSVFADFQDAIDNLKQGVKFKRQITKGKTLAIKLTDCSFFVDFKTSRKILEVVRTKHFEVYETADQEHEIKSSQIQSLDFDEFSDGESENSSNVGPQSPKKRPSFRNEEQFLKAFIKRKKTYTKLNKLQRSSERKKVQKPKAKVKTTHSDNLK